MTNHEEMESPTDWIPPSGQQATKKQTFATPSPPDQPRLAYKRRHPPTPDLFPSPSTKLDSSGRKRVKLWADGVGVSPQENVASEEKDRSKPKLKPKVAEIRKISNIQPGKDPMPVQAESTGLKMQANGLALPQKIVFDPWNACTTGHQRADNKLSGSTSWRENRESKLKNQFGDVSGGGGKRLADTVGAGSETFGKDGRKANGGWEKGAPGLRGPGQKSIVDCFRKPLMRDTDAQESLNSLEVELQDGDSIAVEHEERNWKPLHNVAPSLESASTIGPSLNAPTSSIFQSTCIYINGSTYPLISDHLLRQIIVQNGGTISIALGRRTVTHVVLTHKSKSAHGQSMQSAGGGLANQKVRKEVERKGAVGVGVKYVTAHWVIESVKAGKRLPEGQFADWRFVERGQEDVREFFGLGKSSEEDSTTKK
jgi:DNA-binding XRE family transcriptional regulator